MIRLTRLDGSEFYVNAEFIQSVESNPDTHVILLNGHSYIVTETDEDVVARMLAYRRSASSATDTSARLAATAGELRLVEE